MLKNWAACYGSKRPLLIPVLPAIARSLLIVVIVALVVVILSVGRSRHSSWPTNVNGWGLLSVPRPHLSPVPWRVWNQSPRSELSRCGRPPLLPQSPNDNPRPSRWCGERQFSPVLWRGFFSSTADQTSCCASTTLSPFMRG
jgi:hypothetical protein